MTSPKTPDHVQIDWNAEIPDPTLIEFVKGFQENRKKEAPALKRLLDESDFEALRKVGHNWKGFSRPYGYIALEGLGRALEEAAKSSDLEKCEAIYNQFLEYIEQKDTRLRSNSSDQ